MEAKKILEAILEDKEVTEIVLKNNYVEALELLLEHKNKEIESLNKLIDQLKDAIKRQ